MKYLVPFILTALFLSGCVHPGHDVDRKLMAERGCTGTTVDVAAGYLVGCPDVLEIAIAGQHGLSMPLVVEADGKIELVAIGKLRVEGRNVATIAGLIAERADVPESDVKVRVVDYRSQQVYLFGQVIGPPRPVPYQGPETVLSLLQRTGGITRGAAPRDVYVIRPHVVDGTRPQVIHVDLQAIVIKNDQSTNVRLQPFDQIHVGQTRQCLIERCLPHWLRPFYQAAWDTRPELGAPEPAPQAKSAEMPEYLPEPRVLPLDTSPKR
jgi:protein involved in polysaccharide export with SLBB domain